MQLDVPTDSAGMPACMSADPAEPAGTCGLSVSDTKIAICYPISVLSHDEVANSLDKRMG